MNKIVNKLFLLSLVLTMMSCGTTPKEVNINEINKVLTSLAEVYTAEFDNNGPDDVTKIDYSVRHLYIMYPQKFVIDQNSPFIKINESEVNNAVQEIFLTPISEPQNTNEIDYKNNFYQFMPSTSDIKTFCIVDKIEKQVGDTVNVSACVYSVDINWKGDINNKSQWQTIDSENIPTVYKELKARLLITDDNKYKVLEYGNINNSEFEL
ncbi:MAG: hypothetical protein MJ211_06845 [Bacteroidales bacterium]|nr:hypothetical protein [Bacteroidales bacterium]